MTRVYVVVEGPTEGSFVEEVLAESLWAHEVYLIPLLLGGTGGNPSYARLKKDVLTQLKQDHSAYCSTMLDFYGLKGDFPGMPITGNLTALDKAVRLEQGMKADIVSEIPNLRPDVRFLPYLQLHEYEGLLFSDTLQFARGIYRQDLGPAFQGIRAKFPTPEDINDQPGKTPTKRIIELFPVYQKRLHGTLAALQIGVTVMRQECPHFRSWIEQLESLGG